MNSGHGGITLGSEMGGGVQNIYARNLQMLNQNWATNPLNIAIRIKTNMNRGGFVKNFYVDTVTLPNGVSLKGAGYGSALLSGSPINATVPLGVVTATAANPSAAQGGLITFDCDYQPANDAIRIRPAVVQNVNISNVTGEQRNAQRRDRLVLSGDRRPRACRVRLQRPGPDADHSADQRRDDLELQSGHGGLGRARERDHAWTDLRVQRATASS